MGTTSKKVKYIGTEKFINMATGEVEEMQVSSIEDRDYNFTKVWLHSLLADLDLIGNKKMKVATYIFDNINRDNIFIGTQRAVSAATNVSYPMVSETFRRLADAELLKQTGSGIYMVNPDKIYKGSHNQRLNMLKRYQESGNGNNKKETDEQKLAKLLNTINQLQKMAMDLQKKINDNQIDGQMSIQDSDCHIA